MGYNRMNKIQIENNMDLDIIEDPLRSMRYRNKNKKGYFSLFQPLIGTIMFCFIVVFVLFFSSCGKEEENDKINSVLVRLDQIEKKQLKYTEIIAQLETLFKHLEESDTNLKTEVEKINKQVGILQKEFSNNTKEPMKKGTVEKEKTSKVKRSYYEVQEGDSLYGIANKYGLSVEELCSMNNISKRKIIRPGQKIIIK